jgi:hypothetical protein
MTTAKILLNSTIFEPEAKWFGIDLKDFYPNTTMDRREYVKIPYNLIPKEIQDQYNLTQFKTNDNSVYFEVQKGMYGLPQAGIIAHEQLKQHLKPHGYEPCKCTPGLWRHRARDIRFCLVVDDFGVKYKTKADAQHLIDALQEKYETTIDWKGSLFCGITLDWNYKENERSVSLSMPGYISKCLNKFQHKQTKQQDAPHPWNEPVYG